jgi:hypothetical protein
VSLKTYRALAADARAALRTIGEVVEQNAPPGSMPYEKYVEPPFAKDAKVSQRGKNKRLDMRRLGMDLRC